jgi:hypothetical protein
MPAAAPENYLRIDTGWGPKILAFGRRRGPVEPTNPEIATFYSKLL